jgi:hypothetical protein
MKQPKHVVAKYSEYIIFIVLSYSDPTIRTDFLSNYLETRKISEGKICQLHKMIHFAIQFLFDMFITEINIYKLKLAICAKSHASLRLKSTRFL